MQTEQQKVSYIIGRQIGGDFMAQGLDLDLDIFADSVRSSVKGEPSKLSDDEIQTVMDAFQEKMKADSAEKSEAAASQNKKDGEAYLEKNAKEDGVTVTKSGLQYKVITSGDGKSPEASSTVETHYEGTLLDGTVFDSSYKRGTPATFPVNGVIAGWTEALMLMKEGDVWELTIPSELAYGNTGAGGDIAPGATLVFKIELIKVT